MNLALIPQPQKIKYQGNKYALPARGIIGITGQSLYPVAGQLRRSINLATINIHARNLKDDISICLVKQPKRDGYKLQISGKGIMIEADSVRAAFWAAQTLLQILQQSGSSLPCLQIDDWPDLQDRGVYYDVCRGRVPKLERLLELADILSKYKINQLQLYIEHTFAFRGHPVIGRGASPLSAEDILKLDAYCRERHVELVPSLASFGHLSNILRHPQYRHLAEDWGRGEYVTPDREKRKMLENLFRQYKEPGYSLSPANPGTYRFLDSLFAEFLPLFSSGRFNACCDETYDLGYGQSYHLGRKIGRGRLYLNHIIKLNALSRKYGKQMMFWGDIIHQYPELIPEIPKDVIVLDWGYHYKHPFERIRTFKKAGLNFYVCPSVSGYGALFPRLPQSAANIAGWAAAARKYGARGMLNTDWGDGGHYNFMEYSWPGLLFGAEQAWNAGSNKNDFTRRFSRLFMNIADTRFSNALDELGRISHLHVPPFFQSIWSHIFFSGARTPVWDAKPQPASIATPRGIREGKAALNAGFGKETADRLDVIREVFCRYSGKKGKDPLQILPYWIFAVDTIRHAARKIYVNAPDGNRNVANLKTLQKEMLSLRSRFVRLWMKRNRRSEIGIALKGYTKARRAELTFNPHSSRLG